MSRADALLARARATADPEMLLPIALTLLAEGHPAAAAEAFRVGLTRAPHRVEFELGVAASLIGADQLDEAEAALTSHLERNPGSATGHLHLAGCHRRRGDQAAALTSLLRAIHLDPDDARALELFLDMHDAEVGEQCLERFAEELGAAGPRLILSARALESGDHERAETQLDAALARVDPERLELIEQAAAILLALDRAEDVVALLEAHDERPVTHDLLLARAYLECDETMLARGLLPRIESGAGAALQPALEALRSELS